MAGYNKVSDEGLGTIYVGGQASGTTAAQKAEKLYARKSTTQGKQVVPAKGFILLKDIDGFDCGFVDLVGEDFTLDLTDATSRSYVLVIRGVVQASVMVPAEVKLAGYPAGKTAVINVHKDQIVVLELTKTEEGSWFATIHGETDGLCLGIQLAKGGDVYIPDSDGTIKIPVEELLGALEVRARKYAEEQALYWN